MRKRLFAGLLALCMVFNLMPATAFAEETTTEPVVTEVVCEAKEDCTADEHIETCAKYVAPVVECEAKEDCPAETHIQGCEKYVIPCTSEEDCLAEEHTEGCPADVVYLPCPTDGCELAEGHDGECTGAATFEEVADTAIDTEEELAAAITTGGTVVLAADITINNTLTVPAGVEVILDLNGKTISQSKECTESYEMISNKGNLTITGNGKISFTDTSAGDPDFGWGSYTIRNEGTLVVENGTIEHLGVQEFATHMICAIFQYSGSSTIKDGIISTPNYRSARLWKDDMTIEGGSFDGQLWVQAVDNTSKLVIKGGSFAPNGGDGSSVFVTNDKFNVDFAVSDGNFATKIGCSNAAALAGSITGGTFTEAAVNNTDSALLGNGLEFAKTGENSYEVKEKVYVAVNTETNEKYSTLAEAAAAGGSIKLLENIELNEAVAMNTTVELDLNGKTITGTDTTSKNFGLITVNRGNLTVKDNVGGGKITVEATVNSGWNRYSAVIANNQGTVTVKSGTIEHLGGTDMAYAIDNLTNSGIGAATLTIEGGNIVSPYRAIRQFANCTKELNKLEVKGGTITGANKGIWLQSSNAKANKAELVISGGSVSSVYIWTPEGGDVTGLKLSAKQGTVTNDTFVDGLGDPGYLIELVGDTYQITKIKVAEVNGVKYETLQAAIDAATTGATVKLLEDVELTATLQVSADDEIVLDLNGKSVTYTSDTDDADLLINKGNLTIDDSSADKNGTFVFTYTGAANARSTSTVVNAPGAALTVNAGTIENATAVDHGSYAYAIDSQTNGNLGNVSVEVKGGTVISNYMAIRQCVNGKVCTNTLTVSGGTISGVKRAINVQDLGYAGSSDPAHVNDMAVLNISGGSMSSADGYALCVYAMTNKLSVTDGYFEGWIWDYGVKRGTTEGFITGGRFVEEPEAAYLGDGFSALLETEKRDGVTYLYKIGEKPQGEPDKAITPAAPKVESTVDTSGLTETQKEAVNEAISAITDSREKTSFDSALPEAAAKIENMSEEEHDDVVEQLNDVLKNNNSAAVENAEEVTIHVRPYLDVKVENITLSEAGSVTEVTLDITMMYDVVVSTEKEADEIVTAEDKEEGETVNAVVTESGKLDVEKGTEVEITVPLPEIFNPDEDVLVVKHIKDDGTVYYYDAIVNADGTITFINPNGFSTFIITIDNRNANVEYSMPDGTIELASYTVRNITSTSLPLLTKDGYIFKGWNFAGIDGTYSGALTENLLDKLSDKFTNNGSTAIVATPVFVEAPFSSGESSSDDSIAEEVKSEKPVPTDSVKQEIVEAGKEELGTLIGDSYGLYKLALSVKLEGELDKATNIKIKVDGVTKADSVIILQKTADGWKAVPAEAGDGYVIGKFTSLSEVLIFVNPNGEAEAAQAPELVEVAMTSKPASTGDSANVLAYAGMITVAAAGLAVLFFRKRRA